jgi:hypothetical protein
MAILCGDFGRGDFWDSLVVCGWVVCEVWVVLRGFWGEFGGAVVLSSIL